MTAAVHAEVVDGRSQPLKPCMIAAIMTAAAAENTTRGNKDSVGRDDSAAVAAVQTE